MLILILILVKIDIFLISCETKIGCNEQWLQKQKKKNTTSKENNGKAEI